jgi:hypothetical protein
MLESSKSLEGSCQVVGQSHFTQVDVFVGAVPFVAHQPAGPIVQFIVDSGEEREPLGQFHVYVGSQIVIDIGGIVFELRVTASVSVESMTGWVGSPSWLIRRVAEKSPASSV